MWVRAVAQRSHLADMIQSLQITYIRDTSDLECLDNERVGRRFLCGIQLFAVNCGELRIPLHALRHCSARREIHTHTHAYMAEQAISLDGADGISPGAANAGAEGERSRRRSCGHPRPADYLGKCARPRDGALPREA